MADLQRKTENLFDSSKLLVGYHYDDSGELITRSNRMALNDMIDVSSVASVTITYDTTLSYTRIIAVLYSNDTLIGRYASLEMGAVIDTSLADTISFAFYSNPTVEVTPGNVYNIMLNTGSTALPYEPYGWVHSLRKLTTNGWQDANVKEWDGSQWNE